MVRQCLARGLHVFCEKPFCLDPAESVGAHRARRRPHGLVTQVGYHYRFVGAFDEVKRLLDAGAIGQVTQVLAEAYGPVVLKPQGATWRSKKNLGGGSLYDYAAHPLNLRELVPRRADRRRPERCCSRCSPPRSTTRCRPRSASARAPPPSCR